MKTFNSLSDNISITDHLLTESKVITGKSQTEAGFDVLTSLARSIHQGQGLRCLHNDQTDQVNNFLLINFIAGLSVSP